MLFTPLPCAHLLFLPSSASVSWCQLTQFQRKPALLRVLPACLPARRLPCSRLSALPSELLREGS